MSRRANVRPLLLGVFALAVLVVLGCGREAVTFNEALVRGADRIETARRKFEDAVKGGNPANARVAHTALLGTIGEVKKEVAALRVPASPGAQKFAEKFQKFLDRYEEAVKETHGERVKQLENPKDTPPEATRKLALKLIQANQEIQSDMTELLELQRQFAKENNIKLKPAPKT